MGSISQTEERACSTRHYYISGGQTKHEKQVAIRTHHLDLKTTYSVLDANPLFSRKKNVGCFPPFVHLLLDTKGDRERDSVGRLFRCFATERVDLMDSGSNRHSVTRNVQNAVVVVSNKHSSSRIVCGYVSIFLLFPANRINSVLGTSPGLKSKFEFLAFLSLHYTRQASAPDGSGRPVV